MGTSRFGQEGNATAVRNIRPISMTWVTDGSAMTLLSTVPYDNKENTLTTRRKIYTWDYETSHSRWWCGPGTVTFKYDPSEEGCRRVL